jgi:hypothetical protein
MTEFKQIETLVGTLEAKLQTFQQVLPRLDKRRGLINFGGNVLKFLFGTAVVTDVQQLHESLDELQSRNSDVVHSLNDQLTYIKELGTQSKLNTDALMNLSSTVKDVVVQSHDRFQKAARDISWLNVIVHDESEVYNSIRQLEFALLLLIQEVNELFAAVHCVLQGKLPISLVNPATLHHILRNVSLQLPENYELIAGNKIEDIHRYYGLIEVAILANANCIRLVMNITLKTASRQFTLYKTFALPTLVSEEKFVKYSLEYSYFGLDVIHHDYILLTEADYRNTISGEFAIRPADVAIYDARTLTCESSLFLQATAGSYTGSRGSPRRKPDTHRSTSADT